MRSNMQSEVTQIVFTVYVYGKDFRYKMENIVGRYQESWWYSCGHLKYSGGEKPLVEEFLKDRKKIEKENKNFFVWQRYFAFRYGM